VGIAWLQGVYSVLLDFGLKDDVETIAVHLREIGKKSHSELRSVSHDFTIPRRRWMRTWER